ncbi:5-oxopent-3-ene-1,2,5-tricarboxylate decarboxylase [Powellomyces hirtus]|nr:5-oxopent-3-ene-1,2,5-tricarboxylate decarboxylase [Powellomyces hirtus]
MTARIVEGDPLEGGKVTDRVVAVQKLLCPIPRPPIVLGIGLNYAKHAKELNTPAPKTPILFTKPGTSVTGPGSPIVIPDVAQDAECDYEAELAVVIGKPCRNVSREDAMQFVSGVTCANDVTARTWQRNISQWCFAKSFDTFCPLGPVLVAPHLLPTLNVRDSQTGGLAILLKLNGKTMQSSRTADMIFDIPSLISFLSQGTTLLPGTVILTGTPAGVGTGRNPKVTLQDGDRVGRSLPVQSTKSIEGIGSLVNRVEFEREG